MAAAAALKPVHPLGCDSHPQLEWNLIEPLIPPAKPGGNKRYVDTREIINGTMYILSSGCQWRAIPKDLPPRSSIHDYVGRWDEDGTLNQIHHAFYLKCRELSDCEASPTAAIIDSQSVKSAEKAGSSIDPHGYDAGRKIKGKNATCLWTRRDCFCLHSCIPPTFKTATAAFC